MSRAAAVVVGVAGLLALLTGCTSGPLAPSQQRGPQPGGAIRLEVSAHESTPAPRGVLALTLRRERGSPLLPPARYLDPCPTVDPESLLPLKVDVYAPDGTLVRPAHWSRLKLAPPRPQDFRADAVTHITWDWRVRYTLAPGVYNFVFRYDYRANYPGLAKYHYTSAPVALRVTIPPSAQSI